MEFMLYFCGRVVRPPTILMLRTPSAVFAQIQLQGVNAK
jgi:hypothetical protein